MRRMILCICNALTENQVRAVAGRGAHCPRAAFRALGCEAQCGTCLDHAREVIDETRANLHAVGNVQAA